MDFKKAIIDKCKKKSKDYKELVEFTINRAKYHENKLISQLAERLKLSERFVKTSKF